MTRTRRQFLRTAGVLSTGGVVLESMSRPNSATVDGDWTLTDITTTTDNGQITDVYVQPDIDYSWREFATPPTKVGFRLVTESDGDGIGDLVEDRELTLETAEGSGSRSYTWPDRVSLVADGPWDVAEFRAAEDGETETTTVPLRLIVTIGNPAVKTQAILDGSFTVTVENAPESASAEGVANTGVVK